MVKNWGLGLCNAGCWGWEMLILGGEVTISSPLRGSVGGGCLADKPNRPDKAEAAEPSEAAGVAGGGG